MRRVFPCRAHFLEVLTSGPVKMSYWMGSTTCGGLDRLIIQDVLGGKITKTESLSEKHFESLSCPSGASSLLFCWSDWRSSPHLYYNIIAWQPPSISFSPSFTPLLISSTPPPLYKIFRGPGAWPHAPLPLYLAGSQLTGHVAHWGVQRAGVQRKDRVLKCITGIFSWCSAVYNEPSYCFSFWKG